MDTWKGKGAFAFWEKECPWPNLMAIFSWLWNYIMLSNKVLLSLPLSVISVFHCFSTISFCSPQTNQRWRHKEFRIIFKYISTHEGRGRLLRTETKIYYGLVSPRVDAMAVWRWDFQEPNIISDTGGVMGYGEWIDDWPTGKSKVRWAQWTLLYVGLCWIEPTFRVPKPVFKCPDTKTWKLCIAIS